MKTPYFALYKAPYGWTVKLLGVFPDGKSQNITGDVQARIAESKLGLNAIDILTESEVRALQASIQNAVNTIDRTSISE